jgi:RNA polymerase sigma factor (sigma-70 family)
MHTQFADGVQFSPHFRSSLLGKLYSRTHVTTPSTRTFVADIEQAHGQALRRFLASHLKNASADVSDLVQEIFLRLLRIKDREAIRNPQAYLFTVASHVLYQHALQRSTRPELMNPLEVAAEFDRGTAPDPADELDIKQRLEKVDRDLARISPRAYAALVMYRGEGMTLMEIGDRLGVSHSSVRRDLVRAIAYCNQRLHQMD